MADFYSQIMQNSGVFLGRTLIQANGSIGGHRYVFVKWKGRIGVPHRWRNTEKPL